MQFVEQGKTEIVLTTIKKFLKQGQRIGFVTPRQVLVIDIQKRLEKIFVNNKIVKCFKNHPPLLGDIVVLTAHKIIKYINQFDLVIIDEIDAFPLSQNIVLQKMALHLAREKTIIISATPPSYLKNYDLLVLKLFQRYHQHHLPIPTFKKVWSLPQSLYRLLHKWKNLKVIVYFPTITLQKKYFAYFKDHFKVRIINSQTYNPSRILFQFINLDLNIIFATSTLERGITIKNLNVIVVAANHQLFTSEVLEQISGRVGRVINFEKGWIYFLAQRQSVAIKKCIKQIKTYNQLSHCHHQLDNDVTFYNFFATPLICHRCFSSIKVINHTFYYQKTKITIFFKYEGVIKELIIRWKFYQDQKAMETLWMIVKSKIPLFKQIIFPPSLMRTNNFYPLVSLIKKHRKYQIVFTKTKTYHQAQTVFKKRKNFISLVKPIKKNFVLIDDLYTSGKTIKRCIDLLIAKEVNYFETIIFATTQNPKKIC